MALTQFQSNMTRGELDPQIKGRIDIDAYYSGVAKATNVLAIPQGGLKKRPGMEYIGTAAANGRMEAFAFSTDTQYLLVFSNAKMEIYKDDTLITNINGSGNDYLTTPWTLAQVQEMDFIQSLNTMIIVHEDVAPRKIVRGASDSTWTITDLSSSSLTNIPTYDFNDASSPTPTSQVQQIVFNNANPSDRFKLSLNGVLTEEIVYAGGSTADELAATQQNIKRALLDHPLLVSDSIGISSPAAPTSRFDVTFSNSNADDWDVISATQIQVQNVGFDTTTTITTPGVARKEAVWSSTRGWPRTVTFHEGRLWFGGSKSLPNTIWGSNVSDFFNFDTGKSFDDNAVIATLDTDQLNAINAIFSNRTLQIYTTGGEFFVDASPITPENIAVKPQTRYGCKRVRPVSLSGQTYFIQRTGNVLNNFVYSDTVNGNVAEPVSILSPHLIDNPTQMAVKRGSSSSDVNYIYLVGTNGTLTVFNTVPSQAIEAFTEWVTTGNIKSVAVVDDTLYFLVEREINSSTVYYIEKENANTNTDACTYNASLGSATFSGLTQLEGEEIVIKADGANQAKDTVASGQVTLGASATIAEGGLEFTPTITTMPINVGLQNGSNIAKKKRIRRCSLELYNTNGVIVNSERISDKTIGQDQFDAPSPQSGIRRMYLGGWSTTAQITITQDTPFDMQILNIIYEVDV